MKIISRSSRFAVSITFLICVGFVNPPIQAQTFSGQPMMTQPPVILRTIITPVVNSSVVKIRFENDGRGSVQMQIRDARGKVLYDESQPKRAYAGQFDLASFPTGLYTIELRTMDARHTEMIRVESPGTGRVVALSEDTISPSKWIAKQ